MTRRDEHEQAKELAELWQRSLLPLENEGVDRLHERQREKRLVGAIGDAIVREQGKRRRSRFVRAFGALSLAAAVLGAVFVGRAVVEQPRQSTSQAAQLEQVLGDVQAAGIVTLQRGRAPSVIDASSVHAGDRITTAVNATAALKLGRNIAAKVAEGTEISVEAPLDSTQRMRLAAGRIEATVDNRPTAQPKLVVETPDVDVVVRGTVLQVEVLRRNDLPSGVLTRVSVKEGHVDVRRDGQVVATVAAGETWASGPELVTTTAVPLPLPLSASGPDGGEPSGGPSRRFSAPAADVGGQGAQGPTPGTLAIENALFEAAVSAKKRGSHHVALSHLEDLLTRYPGSPLAAEARLERTRALEKLGQKDEGAGGAPRRSPPADSADR